MRRMPPPPTLNHRQDRHHTFADPPAADAAVSATCFHRAVVASTLLVVHLPDSNHTDTDLASPTQVNLDAQPPGEARNSRLMCKAPSPCRTLNLRRLCCFCRVGDHNRWRWWRRRWRRGVCQRQRHAPPPPPCRNERTGGATALPASRPVRRLLYQAPQSRPLPGGPWQANELRGGGVRGHSGAAGRSGKGSARQDGDWGRAKGEGQCTQERSRPTRIVQRGGGVCVELGM